jgi:transcriptional regulator with XRE-family HTH domain
MTTSSNGRLAVLQERLLDSAKAAVGSTDRELAELAGVDRTVVSRWRSGEREMSLGHLRSLVLGLGDSSWLHHLVGLGECDVLRRAGRAQDIQGEALELVGDASALATTIHRHMADGTISRHEAAELRPILQDLVDHLGRISSAVPRE